MKKLSTYIVLAQQILCLFLIECFKRTILIHWSETLLHYHKKRIAVKMGFGSFTV